MENREDVTSNYVKGKESHSLSAGDSQRVHSFIHAPAVGRSTPPLHGFLLKIYGRLPQRTVNTNPEIHRTEPLSW
jgi:hypothetical protein